MCGIIKTIKGGISIHAPGWGATMCVVVNAFLQSFISIHAPGWGATFPASINSLRCSLFQSTHPGGVRREVIIMDTPKIYISIHAPGWGATDKGYWQSNNVDISIHAPGWGATKRPYRAKNRGEDFNPRTRVGCDLIAAVINLVRRYFNPRTRMGCDVKNAVPPAGYVPISIHAPAWGATFS